MYFDIAPIDFGHLLLDRLWEFDQRIMHDGAKNTYSFVWDSQKIVLLPSKDSSTSLPPLTPPSAEPLPTRAIGPSLSKPTISTPATLLCSYTTFMAEFQTEGYTLALVPTAGQSNAQSSLPPSLTSVLNDFGDVFPTELPEGLPPLRDIQHQINFFSWRDSTK